MDATFASLVQRMQQTGFVGACAVGLSGIENYDHASFVNKCRLYPSLVPVAGIDPLKCRSIPQELAQVKELGFQAIKVHPRFSQLTNKIGDLAELLHVATNLDLTVFYCTYMHCPLREYPSTDPFYELVRLLQQVPGAKVVLVHGGDVELLKYAELVRFNYNLLLDLSMTIMKYKGSSIDTDIRYLFEHFDRRICVGTDHPEYDHASLRQRFEHFAGHISQEKLLNIGHRNIERFLFPE